MPTKPHVLRIELRRKGERYVLHYGELGEVQTECGSELDSGDAYMAVCGVLMRWLADHIRGN